MSYRCGYFTVFLIVLIAFLQVCAGDECGPIIHRKTMCRQAHTLECAQRKCGNGVLGIDFYKWDECPGEVDYYRCTENARNKHCGKLI
jgi:hypothetical protein